MSGDRTLGRREFLMLGGVALGGAAAGVVAVTRADRRQRVHRAGGAGGAPAPGFPRYYVQILLSGGHDPVYTTDPKTRKQLLEHVHLPDDNRIESAGNIQFGPHFAPLLPWASKMAVVNGVAIGTANHETGLKQFFRLKSNVTARMPTALDIIAAHRDGQPLAAAYLNLTSPTMHSPGFFGTADPFYFGTRDVFAEAQSATPDELKALARVLRGRAKSLRGASTSPEAQQTASNLDQTAAFFDAVPGASPFRLSESPPDYTAATMSASLDRALWLLENDLACGIGVDLGDLGWDTHIRNAPRQTEMSGNFVKFFDRFLKALHTTKNEHGLLADQTVIVVGSEMGRFPRLNDMLGKDHLPQTGFCLLGPGIRGGETCGGTGREMEGLPMSFRTGKPDKAGRIPTIDDIGTTLVHMAGLDPQRYGFIGNVLDCVRTERAG